MKIWNMKSIPKFYHLGNAIAFIAHCIQTGKWSIVMGDDEKFWVVTNREASELQKLGYELVDPRS